MEYVLSLYYSWNPHSSWKDSIIEMIGIQKKGRVLLLEQLKLSKC